MKILERKVMRSVATILKRTALWAFGGAAIGWIAGFAYYFLISVPRAESMNLMARESFLCAEGQAHVAFAILGIIIGSGIAIARMRAERAEQTHSMWLW